MVHLNELNGCVKETKFFGIKVVLKFVFLILTVLIWNCLEKCIVKNLFLVFYWESFWFWDLII